MNDDLISRKKALDAFWKLRGHLQMLDNTKYADKVMEGLHLAEKAVEQLESEEPEPKWTPIKTRPMTAEEREYYEQVFDWKFYSDEEAVIFDCKMPEDGQEVWVCSKCGNVWQDTCCIDEGIGLEGNGDWEDIVAWMPFTKPTPWKGESDDMG